MGSRRKTLLTKPTSGEHLRFTMNQDIRGVLIALIIIIVIFALGMAGHYLG